MTNGIAFSWCSHAWSTQKFGAQSVEHVLSRRDCVQRWSDTALCTASSMHHQLSALLPRLWSMVRAADLHSSQPKSHMLTSCLDAMQRLRLQLRLPAMAPHLPRLWPPSRLSANVCTPLPQRPLTLRHPLTAALLWPMPTHRLSQVTTHCECISAVSLQSQTQAQAQDQIQHRDCTHFGRCSWSCVHAAAGAPDAFN